MQIRNYADVKVHIKTEDILKKKRSLQVDFSEWKGLYWSNSTKIKK